MGVSDNSRMITITPMTAGEFFARPETPSLLAAYRQESAAPSLANAGPDESAYETLIDDGRLSVFGALDGDTLVGFITVLFFQAPHFAGVTLAAIESVYVQPESRRKGAGLRLINAAKSEAKARGIAALFTTAPAGGRFEQYLDKTATRTASTYRMDL